jgi:hypothetical protein
MRPVVSTVTVSGATSATPVGFNYHAASFNIGIQTVVGIGASSAYSIQYTMDDIYSSTYSAATGNWTNISTISGATASGNASATVSAASHTVPCTAMRLNTSGLSGTITATFIQTGIGDGN